MEPAPQPLVVVDSLSPLRRFLDRAKLPPDVLALQAEEEPPAEAGQQNDKGRLDGEAGVLLVRTLPVD